MTIPKAVSPSVLTPGMYLSVNLLAGSSSPGTGTLRVAIVSPKSAAGNLVNDTEVRAGSGPDSAATAFGPAVPGHLCAKAVYDVYPQAQVDFVSAAPGSTANTLNLTFANTPSSDVVLYCDLIGREFESVWEAAVAPDDYKTVLIADINQRSEETGIIASSGGTGIVTLTYCITGNHGKDARVYFKLSGQTGSETINGGTSVSSSLTGGTTDPDYADAIASLSGREYAFIILCASNTDVAKTTTANSVSDLYDYIDAGDSGLNAKLQTFCVGCTGTVASILASTPSSNSCNNATFGEVVYCLNGRDLPCELAGRQVGGWLKALSMDPAANRIGEMFGIAGAKDKIASRLTPAEVESLLGGGVSVISYDAQDNPVLVRAVTTHSQTSTGAPDRRLLDCQNVHAEYIVDRYLRDNLPLEFPQAKISPDLEPGDEDLPEGVIEERDIKAWIIDRLRMYQRQGVVVRQYLDACIADGTLIVKVDDIDPTQVNLVVPKKIYQPLAKWSLVSQRVPG